jgi:flagellar hook assembly protein FlgD
MKNVKRMLVVALCGVMMSGVVMASNGPGTTKNGDKKNDPFEVGMYRIQNSLSMKVLLEKEAGEKVFVRLLNQKGQVLYEETLNKKMSKYSRNFDFSQVNDGKYTLEVTDGKHSVRKEIRLSTKDIVETPGRTLVAMN